MGDPVRVAFCKILWAVNGGSFTSTGLPYVPDARAGVRGRCNRAYDCGECSFLQTWLTDLVQQGWEFGWECDGCLRSTKKSDEEQGVQRRVQGFFQAGRKSTRGPDDPEYDQDKPGLEGCTSCGWESSFLQLVLRKRG